MPSGARLKHGLYEIEIVIIKLLTWVVYLFLFLLLQKYL